MLLACLPAGLAQGEALAPVTLEYWILGSGKQKDSDLVWEKVNEEIQKYLPNTTVHFTDVTDSEYEDRWSRAMASGETIDLAWTGWFQNLPVEAARGALLPLDDLLAQYGQDILAFYGEDILGIHRVYDNRLYQIPVWQGLVGGRYALRFPKELADLAGENWVTDFQDVLYANSGIPTVQAKAQAYAKQAEYLAAAQEAGKIAMGYNMYNGFYQYYLHLGTTLVGDRYYAYVENGDDTFTVQSYMDSDLVKLNTQTMADWFQKGYIRPDIASVESVINDWRTDGIQGYITGGSDGLIDIAKHATAESGFEFVAAYTNPNAVFQLGNSTGTSIPYTAKNPERATMLMNLLVSDAGADVYRLFVYGIEGTHWNYSAAGDGTIETTGGLGQATGDWAYGNWKWTLGTCTHAFYTQSDIVGEYEMKKELEKTAYVNPLLGFSFNADAVQTEQINLTAIYKEYEPLLLRGYTGADWETHWNEYIAKLQQAGLPAYLAELQRQVTEYVEQNSLTW
jgi:putative aldouronate transport system substrate-binding protein